MSHFSKIVSGPIVRYADMSAELAARVIQEAKYNNEIRLWR